MANHSPSFFGTSRTTLRYVSFQLYRGLSSKIASLDRIGLGADESRSRSPLAPNSCMIIQPANSLSRKISNNYHFINDLLTILYSTYFTSWVILRCINDKMLLGGKLNVPADTPLSTGTFIPFRSETEFSSKPPEQIDYQ